MEFLKICLLLCLSFPSIFAYKEITGILESATDITPEERNMLWPLFENLQAQYDYILSEATQNGVAGDADDKIDPDMLALYESTRREFEHYFDDLFTEKPSRKPFVYDTSLPTVEQLIGPPRTDLTQEELNEFADMEAILEDALSEAQGHVDKLVKRAVLLETQLIKLDKPKIVMYIYNALSVLFQISVRGRRAAYCTYSHIPELNETLHNIYAGVDCYTYTLNMVLKIQDETVHTVSTIRENVFDLAAVYKKVAAKKSLLGKISTLILNAFRILGDVRESLRVGMRALDSIQNELPDAAKESVICVKSFADGVPQMIETAATVGTCVMYVDDDKPDWDFMKPEEEREQIR